MRWVRSPLWDSFWILSAPVLALGAAFGMPHIRLPWIAILLTLNFAHALSPIVLAWSHGPYRRQVMLSNPWKFIGVPGLVMGAALGAAVLTWLLYPHFIPRHMVLEHLSINQLGVPIVIWANLYAVWNQYHAGAQNYGLLCLYRGRGFEKPRKYWVLAASVAVTILLGHELYRLLGSMTVYLLMLGLVTINHWLAAIGLAAHVDGRQHRRSPLWFVGFVLVTGCLLSWGWYAACGISVQIAVLALCLRGGLGIWHFLQDRWCWQMSNPQVRVTIGRDLLEP